MLFIYLGNFYLQLKIADVGGLSAHVSISFHFMNITSPLSAVIVGNGYDYVSAFHVPGSVLNSVAARDLNPVLTPGRRAWVTKPQGHQRQSAMRSGLRMASSHPLQSPCLMTFGYSTHLWNGLFYSHFINKKTEVWRLNLSMSPSQ